MVPILPIAVLSAAVGLGLAVLGTAISVRYARRHAAVYDLIAGTRVAREPFAAQPAERDRPVKGVIDTESEIEEFKRRGLT